MSPISTAKYFVYLLVSHKVFIWRQLYAFKIAAARRGMRLMLRLEFGIVIKIIVHIGLGEEILVEAEAVLRLLAKGLRDTAYPHP